MSLRPKSCDCDANDALINSQSETLRTLFRFEALNPNPVADTDMLKRDQPGSDVTQAQWAADVVLKHTRLGGVVLFLQNGTFGLRRVPRYFDKTWDVPSAARTLGFAFENGAVWMLRNRTPRELPSSLVQAYRGLQDELDQREKRERARVDEAASKREQAAQTILDHSASNAVELGFGYKVFSDYKNDFTDEYTIKRKNFDKTWDVTKAASMLGFFFDRSLGVWIIHDVQRLPKSLREAFERLREKKMRLMEEERARNAEIEARRKAEEARRKAEEERREAEREKWRRREEAEREAWRRREEERIAHQERVRAMRERLKTLFQEVVSGERDESAFEQLSDDETEFINELKDQRRQKRRRELEEMVRAIDAGDVPANAIDTLSDDEDRAFVARLAAKNAMARAKTRSDALVSEIAFSDPKLVEIYYKLMQVVANGFRTLETSVRQEHERRFSDIPFESVKDSHSKGLNTVGFNQFSTWAFGHYSLYIRITASSPGIKWTLSVSDAPFNEQTGRAVDHAQNELVKKEMVERYKYASTGAIVRNSGTLIIALNALWEAADSATRERAANAEVDTTPRTRNRNVKE